ncbi:DUF3164 family protein [Arachidicoccus soli]|uniref:DUF3164 family protein n=1 Tax=Arachidicoccus soli TaxID=2341117 RepID=A0A386HQK7_9BACT|nr:DUF3164 family protein [Arachidicoccus soli]AYD48228.1 DUF3164 family protein [Arachidicoccus soli]
MEIKQQKSTEKTWYNEAGEPVPYNRTTAYERSCEKNLPAIARKALAANEQLQKFKEYAQKEAAALYELFLKENNTEAGKGNKVFYTFDRNVKLEVNVNERISFDENTIGAAKAKFDEFFTRNTEGIDEIMKTLILSAFETSKGRMDVKKILSIKRHADRINDKLFTEACKLIDKAIRRDSSKTYINVWVKDEDGKYVNIDLNFSSI